MKRRVEAGDRGHARQGGRNRVQGRQRLRLVQRRQLGQRSQLALHLPVDQHRLAKPLATVDDAVPDGVGVAEPVVAERGPQRSWVDARLRRRKLDGGDGILAIAQQAQLERARAGIDDEDAHEGVKSPTLFPS